MADPTTHYTVLARRFRPQTFDEVIGQQHVAQSLQNAIRSNRVAHAYLFTGARGVGKTSMARILAKALNCPNAVDGVPCNACEICDGIAAGNDVDVQEIDGASNRGIDDIRSLRANVNVKSMRSGHKIYIIDEVHMLTKEAFNALLKTLEEPPPNVKFVFCTTEPNKVPDTILSRCQRFDFSTIETQNIVIRLRQIAELEGCEVDADALELVARRAAGSMRDSQSIFDQLLAFGEGKISADDVHRMLGTAADDRMVAIVEALMERRSDRALSELDAMLTSGVELGELVVQLLNYFRDLMIIASNAAEIPLLGVSDHFRSDLDRQAQGWGIHTIMAALEILVETQGKMFRASYGRALAELALVRISLLSDLDQIDNLLNGLREGTLPPTSAAPPKQNPRSAPPASAPPSQTAPRQPNPQNSAGSDHGNTTPPSQPVEDRSNIQQERPVEQPHFQSENSLNSPPVESQNGSVSTSKPVSLIDFKPGCEEELWTQVVANVDDAIRSHVKSLDHPAITGPNQLDLLFPASYHFSKQYCDRPEVRGQLEKTASKLTGQSIRLVLKVQDVQNGTKPNLPPQTESPKPAVNKNQNSLLKDVEQDPFVGDALSIFNGTIRNVYELPQSGGNDIG